MSLYRHSPDVLFFAVAVLVHWLAWRELQKNARVQKSLRWKAASTGVFVLSVAWIGFCIFGSLPGLVEHLPRWHGMAWVRGLGELWGITAIGAGFLYFVFAQLEQRYKPERREFLEVTRTALLASPALVTAYGTAIERKAFEVKEIDLKIKGLHPDLNGLRIVHLSDIHLSPFLSARDFARAIDMANEAKGHVCLVTGDFITGPNDPLEECIQQLARIRCDAGIYGCNGNHEIFAGAEEKAKVLSARRGIQVLRGENRLLQFGKGKINLAGVDYQAFRQPYLVGANRLMEPGMLNVLMSHNPDVFPVAVDQGWDVTLAGHTHGGQVTVEILHQWANVARIFTPFVSGKYEKDGRSLYVTRGIGTVGIPARVGAPPEVSIIRLCAS